MMDEKLLIFGAGNHARKLACALRTRGNNIYGFVTTGQHPLQELEGFPVYTWKALPTHLRGKCPIACGIFNRTDAYDKLAQIIQAQGFDKIIWPWDYYPYLHHDMGWCYWLDSNPRTLSSWQQDTGYQKVMSMLGDHESRSTLERILSFRTGNDIGFASFTSFDKQYFNSLTINALPTNRSASYLDVGAYTGDTLESLLQHVDINKAILVEPDPANYNLLIENLISLTRLHPVLNPYVLPIGAGEFLSFMGLSGEGEATAVSIGGDYTDRTMRIAAIAPLDSIMPAERFDLIKVDVEGHDIEALQGMRSILRRSHAVIGISLYHRPLDIVHLPLAVMDLLEGLPYKYFIRQHMHNSFETVLYAIPTSQEA